MNAQLCWEGKLDAQFPVLELYAGVRPNVVPAFAKAIVGGNSAELTARVEAYAAESGRKLTAKDLGDGKVEIRAENIDGLTRDSIKLLKRYATKGCDCNMLEVMGCEGGCISGLGCVALPKKATRAVEAYVAQGQNLKDQK